jgi:hypothetical protein
MTTIEPQIRFVRGRWQNDQLVPPAPLTSALLGGGPRQDPVLGGERCLVYRSAGALHDTCTEPESLATELEQLKASRAENVLRFHQVKMEEGDELLVLACEAPCSLADRLVESRFFAWEETARVFAQVARSVDELHRNRLYLGYVDASFVQLGPDQAVSLAVVGPTRALGLRMACGDTRLLPACMPQVLAQSGPTAGTDLFFIAGTMLRVLTGVGLTPDLMELLDKPENLLHAMAQRAGRDFDIPRPLLDCIADLLRNPGSLDASARHLAEELKAMSRSQMAQAMELSGVSAAQPAVTAASHPTDRVGQPYVPAYRPTTYDPALSHTASATQGQERMRQRGRSSVKVWLFLFFFVFLAGFGLWMNSQLQKFLKATLPSPESPAAKR